MLVLNSIAADDDSKIVSRHLKSYDGNMAQERLRKGDYTYKYTTHDPFACPTTSGRRHVREVVAEHYTLLRRMSKVDGNDQSSVGIDRTRASEKTPLSCYYHPRLTKDNHKR